MFTFPKKLMRIELRNKALYDTKAKISYGLIREGTSNLRTILISN